MGNRQRFDPVSKQLAHSDDVLKLRARFVALGIDDVVLEGDAGGSHFFHGHLNKHRLSVANGASEVTVDVHRGDSDLSLHCELGIPALQPAKKALKCSVAVVQDLRKIHEPRKVTVAPSDINGLFVRHEFVGGGISRKR